MDKNVQISVIIPAHNAEKNIRECLDSIINQTFKDIEIICVNDGSTDETERIIREYMDLDERVTIINQPNLYAGVARNTGMAVCHGKYMVFWDADDLFELSALEEMYEKIEEDQADICVCDADQYDDESGQIINKVYLSMKNIPEKIPFSRKDNPHYIFNFGTSVPWNKMYRREFIQNHGLLFQDLPRANDQYFVLLSIALAESITVVDRSLIKYRINNSDSLTGNLSNTPFCIYDAFVAVNKKLEELNILDNELIRKSFINKALNSIIHGLGMQSDFVGVRNTYYQLKEGGFADLGVVERGEDYYYSVRPQEVLSLMMNKSFEEFLFFFYIEQRTQRLKWHVKYKQLNAQHREMKKEYKAEKKELNRELNKVRKELDWIKNSRGYRILQVFYNMKRVVFFWKGRNNKD